MISCWPLVDRGLQCGLLPTANIAAFLRVLDYQFSTRPFLRLPKAAVADVATNRCNQSLDVLCRALSDLADVASLCVLRSERSSDLFPPAEVTRSRQLQDRETTRVRGKTRGYKLSGHSFRTLDDDPRPSTVSHLVNALQTLANDRCENWGLC